MTDCSQYGESAPEIKDKFSIEVDRERHQVRVGNWTCDYFLPIRERETFTRHKDEALSANGITPPELKYEPVETAPSSNLFDFDEAADPNWGGKMRDWHRTYAQYLGSRFNHRLYGAAFDAWCGWASKQVRPFFSFDGYQWRALNEATVRAAIEVRDHIEQAERDGLLHLVPAIISFKDSPQGIKARIGRAAWKRIAANSKTRNHKIAQMAVRFSVPTADAWEAGLQMRSFGLHRAGLHGERDNPEAFVHADRICPRADVRQLDEIVHLVCDTRRMGEYNPAWSLSRLHREHDGQAERIAAQDYPTRPFCAPQVVTVDGFTFTRLISQAEVAAEGITMRHCVASYAGSCQIREYAVFRVEGPERATLGVSLYGNQRGFDQLYGVCNARVSDVCRSAAMDFLHDGEFEQEWAA